MISMDSQSLPDPEKIIALSATWFQGREDVLGLALVGSYARGTAQPDSDIDIVILSMTPQAYRTDMSWPSRLPWDEIGVTVKSMRDQDYGLLWSRHVMLSSGQEIEYGFASSEWASIDPVDEGTLQVLSAGHRILYDAGGLLRILSEYAGLRKAG